MCFHGRSLQKLYPSLGWGELGPRAPGVLPRSWKCGGAFSPIFTQEREPRGCINLRFLLGFIAASQGQALYLYLPACFFIVLETDLFISVSPHLFAEIRMFPTSLVGVQLKSEHWCKHGGLAWGRQLPGECMERLGEQSLCLQAQSSFA